MVCSWPVSCIDNRASIHRKFTSADGCADNLTSGAVAAIKLAISRAWQCQGIGS